MSIVIIDYGAGNVRSIQNMLKRIGFSSIISNHPDSLIDAKKIILPGVGAFDFGMENLSKLGFIHLLNDCVLERNKPVLGICLGAQLMTGQSEEGSLQGLNWIDAVTVKFKLSDQTKLKVPHMGWSEIEIKKDSPLLKDFQGNERFYFVHSYHFECKDKTDILTETKYGYNFVSSFSKKNIFGVQFHPEKSHKFGMKLLKNFAEYEPA